MGHNETLVRNDLPTLRTLTARILRTFDKATVSDVEAGSVWYAEAREHALALADRAGDVEHAAAVIAHLSPRARWSQNVASAYALVLHGERLAGTMGGPWSRALASLDADDVAATFGAPKTLNFWRNICGDDEAVTVDVWAARVVGIDAEDNRFSRKGVYDAIAAAYRAAARKRGVTPATMQATTWILARSGRA